MQGNSLASQLRELLSLGKVQFAYQKKDGTMRLANGTTNTTLFEYTFTGSRQNTNSDLITYWDFDKNTWRCFHENQLVSINI